MASNIYGGFISNHGMNPLTDKDKESYRKLAYVEATKLYEFGLMIELNT